MTVVALLSRDPDVIGLLSKAFAEALPEVQLALEGEAILARAQVAACWYPPPGSLGALPNLKLVHSIAAGVDHLGNL